LRQTSFSEAAGAAAVAIYLFIANFFATQIIGGAKELVVLL